MVERECTKKSKAFLSLKDVYENRERSVAGIKASGKKVIWTFGGNVPDEVIYAAGMVPVRGWGCPRPWPEADKYLELSFGDMWRSLFESIMNGERRGLMDGLVFSSNLTMLGKLYSYISTISAREPERGLPKTALIDYEVMDQSYIFFDRNCLNTQEFAGLMEQWSGIKITDEALHEAIATYNEYRQALRAFLDLRRGENCRVTGCEALTVIGATLVMEKTKCIPLLLKLVEDAETWPVVDGVRVFYTGSQQESTLVYSMIEAAGGNVVGEDHDWGDRVADHDIKDILIYPLDAITERCTYMLPNSERSRVKVRAKLIPELIRAAGAEAFLVYMNFNDEAYIWDYPTQKKVLDAEGISSYLVTKQTIPLKDAPGVQEGLNEFISSVRREG